MCAFGLPVATCCDMLGVVGSNLKLVKFFMQHLWMLHDCGRLARFVQQCCIRAFALVRFSILNMSQHVTTGWPNARNMLRPTMLRFCVLKCCDHLAGACKCWANNVGICCAEMLRSFGRSLQMLGQQCCDMLCWYVVIVWWDSRSQTLSNILKYISQIYPVKL